MPVYCSVKSCNNNSRRNTSAAFFELPKNESLRAKWLEFIEVSDKRRVRYRICNEHFERKCIWKTHPRSLLIPNAIPTIKKSMENSSFDDIKPQPTSSPDQSMVSDTPTTDFVVNESLP